MAKKAKVDRERIIIHPDCSKESTAIFPHLIEALTQHNLSFIPATVNGVKVSILCAAVPAPRESLPANVPANVNVEITLPLCVMWNDDMADITRVMGDGVMASEEPKRNPLPTGMYL